VGSDWRQRCRPPFAKASISVLFSDAPLIHSGITAHVVLLCRYQQAATMAGPLLLIHGGIHLDYGFLDDLWMFDTRVVMFPKSDHGARSGAEHGWSEIKPPGKKSQTVHVACHSLSMPWMQVHRCLHAQVILQSRSLCKLQFTSYILEGTWRFGALDEAIVLLRFTLQSEYDRCVERFVDLEDGMCSERPGSR